MTGEGAAEICMSLAEDVRLVRSSGGAPPQAMSESIGKLLTARATTAIDALALATMAKKLLSHVVEQFGDDTELFDEDQTTAAFSLVLISRAVAILEAKTGYSAEGFTGEADAIN